MIVNEKIKRVELIYSKLKNENRDNESYKDDLLNCFIQCWSIKEHIKNDDDLRLKYSHIEKMVNDHIKSDVNIQLCNDIANRDKHLKLKKKWVDGDISKSEIGVHYGEHITVCGASVTIEFTNVNDLEDTESKDKDSIIIPEESPVCIEDKTFISQEYEVVDNSGNSYEALTVLDKAIGSWKRFIQDIA